MLTNSKCQTDANAKKQFQQSPRTSTSIITTIKNDHLQLSPNDLCCARVTSRAVLAAAENRNTELPPKHWSCTSKHLLQHQYLGRDDQLNFTNTQLLLHYIHDMRRGGGHTAHTVQQHLQTNCHVNQCWVPILFVMRAAWSMKRGTQDFGFE